MRVLITGSRGFIGSFLVDFITQQNNNIEIVHWDFADGDLANAKTLNLLLKLENIDKVIHLASNNSVPESWENTAAYILGNYTSTYNILEFCRHKKASLIFISSYMYGNADTLPIGEDAALKVNNPYAYSKLSGENLCGFYNNVFSVPVQIFRPFNIYGPGQREVFLIPYLAQQLTDHGKTVIDVNDIMPRRDYLYVTDFCVAMYAALQKEQNFEIYNLGYGISYSVEEVINILFKVAGMEKPLNVKNKVRTNEINDVVADITKVSAVLDWKPTATIEQGLAEVIKYYTTSSER